MDFQRAYKFAQDFTFSFKNAKANTLSQNI